MKKNIKRAGSVVLSLAMMFSLINVQGMNSTAEESETITEEILAEETIAEPPEAEALEETTAETAEAEALEVTAAEMPGTDTGEETLSGLPAEEDVGITYEDSLNADTAEGESGENAVDEPESILIYQTLTASIRQDIMLLSLSDDSTRITLTGTMPEGAAVKALPVDVKIGGIEILAAYDITILDKDGEEYQPKEGAIKVHIENSAIREAEADDGELYVYHMENVNAAPEKVPVLEADNGSVEFNADSFSIYIVGKDDEGNSTLTDTDGNAHYVYTLNFYLGDEDSEIHTLLSAQTVSPGEKVEMPSVPDQENYEFAGWYSKPDGGGELYTFYDGTMPEIEDEQDHVINLYAHYIELHYVHYMTGGHTEGDENTRVIFHSEPYTAGQVLDTSTAEDLYLAEGYLSYIDEYSGAIITALAVTGWKDAEGSLWYTGDTVSWDEIDGDLLLYPVVEAAYWIFYDMNGHDSIENPEPGYVLASETYIGTLPVPEVSGYIFDGWYTEAQGGWQVSSSAALASLSKNADGTVTLYAHWTETYVAYTINIWRQKAIDGQDGIDSKAVLNGETYDDYIQYYDYAESHYVSAAQSRLKTGDRPSESSVDNWSVYTGYGSSTNSTRYPDYYGFEYGTNTTARTRTLNNLETITMASDGSTIINIFYNRVTITWNFGRESSAVVRSGLYDTACDWPSPDNGHIWKTGNTSYTFEAKFKILNNSTSVTFTSADFTSYASVYYYLEVTNEAAQVNPNGDKAGEASEYGVSYTKTVGGTPYVYDRRIQISSSRFTIESKYIGYEYVGYNTNDGGTTITNIENSIANPARNGSYFFFNNANEVTITLISNSKVVGVDAAGNAAATEQEVTYPDKNRTSVKYGADMSNYPFPETLDGEAWGPAYYYHFDGWYADPTYTALFTTAAVPNNNLVAYADWELNDITVTFVTGTSAAEAPETQELKAASKAEDPGSLERDGYTHVGWVDQNGKVFNFDTVLYSDMTLSAIWKADDDTGYTMQYVLNAGNSYGLFDGYEGEEAKENTEHFAVNEELWTIEKAFPNLKDTDYEAAYDMFIGWNTAADGSGTMYYPDSDFTVDDSAVISDGMVRLYAIWAHKNESTLILVYNYPAEYTLQDGETRQDILTGDNLSAINLQETSGLEYHHEIEVTDSEGMVHTYRFDGWSLSYPGDTPTDEAVDIAADAIVAADTIAASTETKANYLFAVWLEVYSINVTKKIVNNAVNYTVPDDLTFTFCWSFTDGEGMENTNEETITIGSEETFTIPDVAAGERVTIEEDTEAGFTASYNGAHIDAADDGNGKYTFTMDENSREITVANTVDTIRLNIEKVWSDAETDGVDHSEDSVTVQIMEDETPAGEPVILTKENNWFAAVEVICGSGKTYSVIETEIPEGYRSETTSVVSDDGSISYTITNTAVVSADVEKVWVDAGEGDEDRPEEISVQLLSDEPGMEEKILTLNAENGWKGSFCDLDKYNEDGKKIDYSVCETADTNYAGEITGDADSGFVITNTKLFNGDGELAVGKEWNDGNAGDRPSFVTVTLYKDGSATDQILTLGPDGWSGSFTDLPGYEMTDEGIKEIIYSVIETAVDKYQTSYSDLTDGKITVTNTRMYNNDGRLTVSKDWDDADNQDGIRPGSVIVTLSAEDEDGEPAVFEGGAVRTITAADNWTVTYEGLYEYTDGGKKIIYTVEEAEVNGYTAAYDPEEAVTEGKVTITNTHTPETVDIKGGKTWNDEGDPDKKPESITIRLLADNEEADSTEVTAWDDWTWNFTGQPVYRNGGTEIVYTITEDAVANYTTEINGYDVTNTYNPDMTTVTITKDWDDDDDRDGKRPQDVTVYLTGSNGFCRDILLNDENSWSASVDVPMYDNVGEPAAYSVSENSVDEYDEPVITSADGYNFTVTNTHTPGTVDVEGSKTWNDGENADAERPESITIRLFADDIQVDSREVAADEDENWTWSFTDLPVYRDGGVEIRYTITEDAVFHYSTAYDGYNVTNTHIPGKTSISVTKVWDDVSDRDEVRPESVTVSLLSDGDPVLNDDGEPLTLTLSGEGNVWTGSFTDLDIYDGEEEIEYTVTEVFAGENGESEGDYTGKVDGDASEGFIITNYHKVTDWSVEKTLTNSGSGEDGAFRAGETAEFTVTVTNTGNTTIVQLEVTEVLAGAAFRESDDRSYELNEDRTVATIKELPPNGVVTLYAGYTIEEKDLGEELVNKVISEGGDPESPAPGPAPEEHIPTEEKDGHLTVTKETTSRPANGTAYVFGEEITYRITVINDGNLTITDIIVTDELTEGEWMIDCLAPDETKEFETSYRVTMDDIANGSVVNEAAVSGMSPDPDNEEVPFEPGTDEEPTDQILFFPMDEEIVPGNDDEANPGSWVNIESVSEYNAIEIEMSTTLPNVSGELLAEGGFCITFHNQLATQLVLDELDEDFTVDINGIPISHDYYEIDMLRLFGIKDGCTFHVSVDLSALYNDGLITDDDFGAGTVRVFFYADLEATDVNGSYTSTAWYDLGRGDEVLYTSEKSIVTVYTFEIIVDLYNADNETGREPLAGAVFGLYYDEECTQPVYRGLEPYTAVTDENGQAVFTGIAEGRYYVKELEAPKGYDLISEPKGVTLAGNENDNHIFEIEFVNLPAITLEPVQMADETLTDSGTGENDASGAVTADKTPISAMIALMLIALLSGLSGYLYRRRRTYR